MSAEEILSRREVLMGGFGFAGALASTTVASAITNPPTFRDPRSAGEVDTAHDFVRPVRGRLKQSVCYWVYAKTPLPELCRRVKKMGFAAVDLLYSDQWLVAQDSGLVCSMGYPSRRKNFIELGFNDPANHATLLKELELAIPKAARAGVPTLIGMFGNRHAEIDEVMAVDNCVSALSKIAPLAEEHAVTICLELLNSKIDHKGYQGDRTVFGAAVVDAVASPRIRLLYDIYHMQIMEGDVIRTIHDNAHRIGHIHTGGVPGRHEINADQELNYHAISRAIAATGYQGYVAHEFIPTRADPFESLAEAYSLCVV